MKYDHDKTGNLASGKFTMTLHQHFPLRLCGHFSKTQYSTSELVSVLARCYVDEGNCNCPITDLTFAITKHEAR